MQRLVLIDGNSLIHRAYHALPPLNAPNGEQVNAVYGFTSMLLRVLQELKPEYIAMTFDLPAPTFRHLQYVGYKANRPAADSELVPQFARVRDVVRSFNIPIFEVAGYEADDLVGTLANQAENLKDQQLETIIVSGDMDTLQLVDDKTKVFAPRKGISDTILFDTKAVEQKYGFGPDQLIDYKGLKGDPSDNIPGVPGIGDKTAQTLIQQYKSLEGVYQHLDDLKGKVKENLTEYAEQAKLSKTLATIDRNAPIKLKLEETKTHDFDRQKILSIFQELGFRSLVNRLAEVFPATSLTEIAADNELVAEEEEGQIPDLPTSEDKTSKTNITYKLVNNTKDLEALIKNLQKAKEFAFDTETDNWRPVSAKLVGCSFSYRIGEAFYVPYQEDFLALLKPILENDSIKKIGHNIKFDALVLANHGITLRGMAFDTLVAAWLINPGSYSLGLKSLVYQEIGVTMQEITELIGKGKKQITMDQVPVEQVVPYACADADMALRLKSVLEKKLKAANVYPVFRNYEMPLVPVLTTIERNGVLIDSNFLAKMSKELEKDIASCLKEIYKNVGHEFNVNSPKQLAQVLFEELHLPTQSKTKTGFSTDESVLSALKTSHPVVEHLLKYREMAKLKSTYIDALPTLVDQETGRVHTSYNQTGAASGRLSSSDPNLQNIPIRTELGAKIRQAFIAPKGSVLLAADYSQIELRILAHLSKDPVLIKAFQENDDVHAVTASIIYGVAQDKVTRDMRRVGKTVNFALMYGMSGFGLSQQLGIGHKEAIAFIQRYFLTYARVKEFFDQLIEKARKEGFVETISGRRRYIPELQSSIPAVRHAGERMAINLPMQGANADIIKKAMIAIQNELVAKSFQTKMILQVHDELVFEVPENELKSVEPKIKSLMINAFHLSVPILVESKVGHNWGELEVVSE